MSPRPANSLPDRDEPLPPHVEDPVAAGFARARRRAVSRMLVGFLAFAAIWATVVGLAWLLDWPMKHAMYLGLVASVVYAIHREHCRRRATHVERVAHRRRWRKPIDWARRAPGREAVRDGNAVEPAMSAPRRSPGPLGGHLLSNRSWGEALLWIIVVAVITTAFVAWIAHTKNIS